MSVWNYFACSIHSEFLQQCFLTEPNLTFIMAPEKLLPRDTMSPHEAEIKGDVSNGNAASGGEAGAPGAQGVKNAGHSRGCEGLTLPLAPKDQVQKRKEKQLLKKENSPKSFRKKSQACVVGKSGYVNDDDAQEFDSPRQRRQL